MKKVWMLLRYSGLGVFFAGIAGVIQGCSVEREGALFATMLLVLNFCSGPNDMEDTSPLDPRLGPGTAVVIDDFAVVEATSPRVVTCGANDLGPETAIPQTFGNFNSRQLSMFSNSVGTSTISFITPGDGTLEIVASGAGTGCDYADNFNRIIEWEDGPGTAITDMSILKRIEIDVVSSTGVTGCAIATSGTNLIFTGQFDPTTPTVLVLNPGWDSDVRDLRFLGCNFAPGGALKIDEIRAIL